MKKILLTCAGALLCVSLIGCTNKSDTNTNATVASEQKSLVTLESKNASGETISIDVPYNPSRIAILDMATLDILDSLNLGDKVVASASTSIDYLNKYNQNENIANIGTIKEANLEAIMAAEPDVIFIGGRLSSSYDELSKIAPVVMISSDENLNNIENITKNATAIASLFGKENEIDNLMSQYTERINDLKEKANSSDAIIGMTTSGSFNILGNDGRCSIIGKEIAFNNIGQSNNESSATHGNESSFEFVAQKNPEYIFVLDRDAAIGASGNQQAKEIIENDLVKNTKAYKNRNIIYLAHPNVWYTADGGIKALDVMLSDLEAALL